MLYKQFPHLSLLTLSYMSTAIRHLPVQVARTRTHLRLFAKTTTGTASIRYLSTGRLAPNSLFTRVSKATHPITVSIHAKSAKLGSSFSTSTSTANMGEIKQFVDGKIAENKVMVFGKSYCPVRFYAFFRRISSIGLGIQGFIVRSWKAPSWDCTRLIA